MKKNMKSDIILSGVGGQGIISIASAIGGAALKNDIHMKQAEVHGMSQRGGAVQSTLRLSSKPIASDLVAYGAADMILSIEPMESLRYLPYLKPEGWLVTNSVPFDRPPLPTAIAAAAAAAAAQRAAARCYTTAALCAGRR